MTGLKSENHHRRRRHHRHHRRRHSKPLPPPIIEPRLPSPTPRILSNIYPVYLEESVDGGIGQYASVSVLDPVMRVERSGGNCASNPCSKPVYRIILSMKMQLSINRRPKELQRHNRIFDSVSMKYLYRAGEKHDLLPKGDQVVSDISMSHEAGKSSEVEAGIIGVAGHIVPALTVHAQHASKLTYERKLRSWRKALTYEKYPPPLSDIKPGGLSALFTPALLPPEPEPPSFRVTSPHAEKCSCRRFRRCRRRISRHHPYDRAAHWSGQTEAQLHLWTPEIYENLNCPLTITREVEADEIDAILNKKGSPSFGRHVLRRYLHFDFDVEVRLREIGWGLFGRFKSSSQPPEIRARNDSGKPLVPDRMQFCVSCCTEKINWPQFETRDLQTEAEEQIARHGYVRRLQSTEEYEDSYNRTVESSASGATGSTQMSSGKRRIMHSPADRLRVFGLDHHGQHQECNGTPRQPGDDLHVRFPERASEWSYYDTHDDDDDDDDNDDDILPPRVPRPPPDANRHSYPSNTGPPPFIRHPVPNRPGTPFPFPMRGRTRNRSVDDDDGDEDDGDRWPQRLLEDARQDLEEELRLLDLDKDDDDDGPDYERDGEDGVKDDFDEDKDEGEGKMGKLPPPIGDLWDDGRGDSDASYLYRPPTVMMISSDSGEEGKNDKNGKGVVREPEMEEVDGGGLLVGGCL